MILTLAWKEYREHRSIWLTMLIMTGILGLGLASLVSPRDLGTSGTGIQALTVLAMAATYGVVCGAMMFAGEWEAGTLVFLDIFLGRRGLLWLWKVLIGAVLALSEALAVSLMLVLLKQPPPPWLPMLAGTEIERNFFKSRPPVNLWFTVLPLVTLEAYACGLLGSSFTRRVLAGAGVAALMAAPFWLITILLPPPVFLTFRLVAAGAVFVLSGVVFLAQSKEPVRGPSPTPGEPATPLERRIRNWKGSDKFDLERRAPRLAGRDSPGLDAPAPVPDVLAEAAPAVRRGPRLLQAGSPRHALLWLSLKQAQIPLLFLAGVGVLVGLFVPFHGQVLWPLATLLLGVACGTAAFAPEQGELSYQFLAAQHFPLKKVWNFKILFWLAAALLLALVIVGVGVLALLGQNLSIPRDVLRPGEAAPGFGAPGRPASPPASFDFGSLPRLLGPVNFFGVWLVYGFSLGQVFVLFCRKSVLAVLLAGVVGAAAVGLWLPSLLCGGMSGWQLWIPPLVMLAATRFLVRAWAGGRIKERKPLAAVAGFGLVAVAWVALHFGFRAWVIPDVGQPLDRDAFRASILTGKNNRAGQRIQEALAELNRPGGGEGPWQAPMAEAARMPVGVIENPQGGGQEPLLRHLPACRDMTARLRGRALAAQADRKPGIAFNYLAQILSLSRNLRNKAPLASYLTGVDVEESALQGLDLWLAASRPNPDLLRQVLKELNRHAAETPAPLDCLQTECYRAGGVLGYPTSWAFYPRIRNPGQVPERWLADGIVLSLEMPWEKERRTRLWRAVWGGLFRAIQTPSWQLPHIPGELGAGKETTRTILRDWLPAAEGPGSSLTAAQLAGLLDASWLSDERLFTFVGPLRTAATRGRWQVDSCRLRLALGLYHLQEGKPASQLADLVPNYLPQLPVDPYSGRAFHYRLSKGERLEIAGDGDFQGRNGPDRGRVEPGQGILWSNGPDRDNNGGRKHGGRLRDDDPRWSDAGFDLVAVVPLWP